MLIFYGTGSAKCCEIPTSVDCPHCGEEKSLIIIPRQNYAHLFWIPLFPLNRTYEWVCSKCEEEPDEYMPIPKEIKRQVSVPKRTYMASLIIIAAILFSMAWDSIGASSKKNNMRNMIETPVVGDVYDIIWDKGEYSMTKVVSVFGDSVYLLHHQYYVKTKSELSGLKKDNKNDYLPEEEGIEGFTKEELLQMFEDGDIFGISRK